MKISRFSILLLLLTAVGLIAGGLIVHAGSSASSETGLSRQARERAMKKLSMWVMEKTAEGKEVEFLVILGPQADLSGAEALETKEEKGRYVFDALRAKAVESQADLVEFLEARRAEHQPFYIVNAMRVRGSRELAIEIAAREEVSRIEGNPRLRGVEPVQNGERESADSAAAAAAPQEIEAGLLSIHAPEVWAMGFTGQGIVIGGQDTGIRWDHPALQKQYRGWNGSSATHDYNWHDSIHTGGGDCGPDAKAPCDDDNHGTHTLGSALGYDGGANQIGVAPGAKFIGCRNMDRGDGTPARYLECFEFMLAPYPVGGRPSQGDPARAPDITINSWTCTPSEGCEPNTLKNAVEAQRAAGIVTAAAAGNAGAQGCASINESPGIYDAAYSIGAIDASTGLIAAFSSRGPVMIDGSRRVKPDISAPGVSVRSAFRNGTYGRLSGTSMATPHVAGAIALLWSARPELRGKIDLTENILNESAARVETTDCGSSGAQNNVYGFGQLNVKAAVDLAATAVTPTEQVFGVRGGTGKIDVGALPGVTWRASSTVSWLTLASVGGAGAVIGIGSATINFTVAENRSPQGRTGIIMVAGRKVTITQPGAAPAYAVSGRVLNGPGEPIGRVTLSFTRISGGGDLPAAVQTDWEGRWSQTGFEPGTTYRVSASGGRRTFSPAARDFNAASTALDFTSIGRGVILFRPFSAFFGGGIDDPKR
ncbi:MAG: S8 family serine peptidase [Blastocatellia bacterium]